MPAVAKRLIWFALLFGAEVKQQALADGYTELGDGCCNSHGELPKRHHGAGNTEAVCKAECDKFSSCIGFDKGNTGCNMYTTREEPDMGAVYGGTGVLSDTFAKGGELELLASTWCLNNAFKCFVKATCADKDGKSGVAVTDDECGSGYIATNTSTKCSKSPCEVSAGSMADKGSCCEAYGCNTTLGIGCASCVAVALRTSSTHCATCNSGYQLSDANCQAYACTIGSGAACLSCVPQASRLSDVHCATCNVGYHMVGSSCQVSVEPKRNATVTVSFSGTFSLQASWEADPAGHLMEKAVRQALAKHLNVNISAVTVLAKVENAKYVQRERTQLSVNFSVSVPTEAAKDVETTITGLKQSVDDLTAEVKTQLLIVGFPEANLGTVQISKLSAKRDCDVGDKVCEKANYDSAMVSEGTSPRMPFILMTTVASIILMRM